MNNTDIIDAKNRIDMATVNPISYYYSAALTNDNNIAYINVNQALNDKFIGSITEAQFFMVAEESEQIFILNKKLIIKTIIEAKEKPDFIFVCNLSAKWFIDEIRFQEFERLIADLPKNICFSLSTSSLSKLSFEVKDKMNTYFKEKGLMIMLDNPEEDKLSLIFEIKLAYIRLDGRYYKNHCNQKTGFLRLYQDFARAHQILVSVNHVDDEGNRVFFKNSGLSIMEGNAILTPKNKLIAITAPFELKNK